MPEGKVGRPNIVTKTGTFVFPDAVLQNGNISSKGINVYGVATSFGENSCMRTGDWIYSSRNNQVRQVTSIASNTLCYINKPFKNDIVTPEPLQTIRTAKYREFSILNASGSAITLGSATLPNNASVDYDNEAGVDPITGRAGGALGVQISTKR